MISAHYEEDPESFNEEIRQLDQIREVSLTGTLLCLVDHWYSLRGNLTDNLGSKS